MLHRYRIVLTWSASGERWIAEVPELPYTAADGETPPEAIANAQILIDEWLLVAGEQQRAIPRPRSYEEYDEEEAGDPLRRE